MLYKLPKAPDTILTPFLCKPPATIKPNNPTASIAIPVYFIAILPLNKNPSIANKPKPKSKTYQLNTPNIASKGFLFLNNE